MSAQLVEQGGWLQGLTQCRVPPDIGKHHTHIDLFGRGQRTGYGIRFHHALRTGRNITIKVIPNPLHFQEVIHLLQMAFQSGFESNGFNRLDNVIVSPSFENLTQLAGVVGSGHDNDRGKAISLYRTQTPADFHSIHSRHSNIEEKSVNSFLQRQK